MTKQTARRFLKEVTAAKSILIGTHRNPDGDAIGCSLAISIFLKSLGKSCEMVVHNRPPNNLEFLPYINEFQLAPERSDHDLGITVDLDAYERLGDTEPYFRQVKRLVVIDHHVPVQAPGDLRLVDTTAPATAVILTRLFTTLNVDINPEMATCLLTGIVTDTGCFRFRNTTPEALHLAARLLELGGDISRINEEVFERKPVSSVRLLGIMLAKMHLECNDRLSWAVLERADFDSTESTDEDTEGFVNELLSIRTVKVAALFREARPGRIRVSLRSRGCMDVSAIAHEYGGGGHRNASGCSFDCTVQEAVDQVVPRLRACLASS